MAALAEDDTPNRAFLSPEGMRRLESMLDAGCYPSLESWGAWCIFQTRQTDLIYKQRVMQTDACYLDVHGVVYWFW